MHLHNRCNPQDAVFKWRKPSQALRELGEAVFVLRLAIPRGTRLKQGFRTDHLYWDTVANLKRVLEADAEAECSNWTPEEGEILREMLRKHSCEKVRRLRGARVLFGLMCLLVSLVVIRPSV